MRRFPLLSGLVATIAAVLVAGAAAQETAAPPAPAASAPAASEPTALEQGVQAAFVTKFPLFVRWPREAFATSDAPFRLCLLGDAPFARDIEKVASKRGINGRALEVSRLGDATQARQCHLLFVGASETARVAEILAGLEGAAVLTVSPIEGFTRAGGMIGFVRSQERVRFEINADAARRAGLAVSSQLLKLAMASNER